MGKLLNKPFFQNKRTFETKLSYPFQIKLKTLDYLIRYMSRFFVLSQTLTSVYDLISVLYSHTLGALL